MWVLVKDEQIAEELCPSCWGIQLVLLATRQAYPERAWRIYFDGREQTPASFFRFLEGCLFFWRVLAFVAPAPEKIHYIMDDLATCLRYAVENGQQHTAVNLLTQIAITGRSHENAALICANSLDTFRDGFARLRALQALELVWTSSEFDGRILASVLRGMKDDNLAVIRIGLSLIRSHIAGPNEMVLAPQVVDAVHCKMCNIHSDLLVQHTGAEIMCMLNAIEPDDYIRVHGQFNYQILRRKSIELAILAKPPVTLLIRGQPWNAKMLQLFPRLRSQAQ